MDQTSQDIEENESPQINPLSENNFERQDIERLQPIATARSSGDRKFVQKELSSATLVLMFLLPIINVWIFILIPTTNYWVYVFIKMQWWGLLAILGFAEILDNCLGDVSETMYKLSYILGTLLPPFLHVISWLADVPNNRYMGVFAVTSAVLAATVIYFISASKPSTRTASPRQRGHSGSVELDTVTGSMLQSDCMYDMFTATERVDHTLSTGFSSSPTLEERASRKESSMSSFSSTTNTQTLTTRQTDDLTAIHLAAGTGARQRSNSVFKEKWISVMHEMRITSVSDRPTIDPKILQKAWYFGKYLPRYVFIRFGMANCVTTGNRREVWAYATMFNGVLCVYYYFLMYFTNFFRNHAQQDNIIQLFLFYVAASTCFRVFTKRVGMHLDTLKRNTASMYFVGEVMCLLFYYTFYRVLFESINSWGEFAIFQVIHLCSEWILYPLRSTAGFYNYFNNLRLSGNPISNMLGSAIIKDGLDHQDWLHFVALDFGMRFVVLCQTGIGILSLFLGIDYIPWIHSDLKEVGDSRNQTVNFLLISILLEMTNAAIMNYLFFAKQNLNVLLMTQRCFSYPRFYILCMSIASCLFINPVFAFMTDNDNFKGY